jgi:leucyl/phenylalanyl-tRNA---protein transferase
VRDPDAFPDPALAHPSGLLAFGGDLSPARLLAAYARGIFPWYSSGEPILWWSPDPRFVLELDDFWPGRTLLRTIRRGTYECRVDAAFEEVIARCAGKKRPGQRGTWITDEMKAAYVELHRLGFAHSFESYREGALAGGIYGVSLGGVFFGESMFTDRSDAGKAALFHLVRALQAWEFDFLDCQTHTDLFERLGARDVPRDEFLESLARSLEKPTRRGRWTL